MSANVERLEALLAAGRDDALLRFALGSAYLDAGRSDEAVANLRKALAHDPGYSAAWKAYGRALIAAGRPADAAAAYRDGIAAARGRGDVQAAREMRVFLRRLEKASD